MGILNVTPDSFYASSRVQDDKSILMMAENMLKEGASILDVGGQSSRPGAELLSDVEELERVIPAIEIIINEFPDAIISIDTFYARVAKAAIGAGASIINDISAGDDDDQMLESVASLKVPYIIMHKMGLPQVMQENPHYEDVVGSVLNYFTHKVTQLQQLGVPDIIIDPGFGFGKTLENNYQLLTGLDALKIFELPVLVGVSRKSMVQKLLNINTDNALNGTTALHMIALQKGARILRVHDVKEAMECIKIADAIK